MRNSQPALDALGIGSGVTVVTRDDVPYAKPDPDLFMTAADRLGVDISAAIVVGDSVWDLLAARRAKALGVGLLSGGYGQDELERAGAYRTYMDPADLMEHLDEIGAFSVMADSEKPAERTSSGGAFRLELAMSFNQRRQS